MQPSIGQSSKMSLKRCMELGNRGRFVMCRLSGAEKNILKKTMFKPARGLHSAFD